MPLPGSATGIEEMPKTAGSRQCRTGDQAPEWPDGRTWASARCRGTENGRGSHGCHHRGRRRADRRRAAPRGRPAKVMKYGVLDAQGPARARRPRRRRPRRTGPPRADRHGERSQEGPVPANGGVGGTGPVRTTVQGAGRDGGRNRRGHVHGLARPARAGTVRAPHGTGRRPRARGRRERPLTRAVAALGLLADRVTAVETAVTRATDAPHPPRNTAGTDGGRERQHGQTGARGDRTEADPLPGV